ncbi:MAG: exodeoxyribonuclease VII large subunit [Helicobacter sp.]|nr:exodeoxyribonuclease VII large subunit [Helicobacter sp.]
MNINKILTPSSLNAQIGAILKAHFPLIAIQGEISNFTRHTSGHLYFTLKDSTAQIRSVMFASNAKRLKIEPKDGQKVIISGQLNVYSTNGTYQINVSNIQKAGLGDLHQQFLELKDRLKKMGLFDKNAPLPPMPKKIALITSKTSAVIHDMIEIAKKRWGLVKFALFNTIMQGANAKNSIIDSLKKADKMGFDIIILARGGGSLEDLWCFNEEELAYAIYELKTPLISAIGHESDFTISDFVADVRASTPSNAIEIALPEASNWLLKLDDLSNELKSLTKARLTNATLELSNASLSLNRLDPRHKINALNHELETANFKLQSLKNNLLDADLNALKLRLLNIVHSLIKQKDANLSQAKELFNQFYEANIAVFTQDNQNAKLSNLKKGDLIQIISVDSKINAEVI